VQIRRTMIERMINDPYFDDYMAGLFVRVVRSLPDGTAQTLCAEVTAIFLRPGAKRYAFAGSQTDKRMRVRHGSESIELPLLSVSNQSITDDEMRAYVAATTAAGRAAPTPAQLDYLYSTKENLRRTFVWDLETLNKALAKKELERKVVTDFEKQRMSLVGRITRLQALVRADVAAVKREAGAGAAVDEAALAASSPHQAELAAAERELAAMEQAQARVKVQRLQEMQKSGTVRIYELKARSMESKWMKYSHLNDAGGEASFESAVGRLFGVHERDWGKVVETLTRAPGIAPVSDAAAVLAAAAATATAEGVTPTAGGRGALKRARPAVPLASRLAGVFGFTLPSVLLPLPPVDAPALQAAARAEWLRSVGPVVPPAPANPTVMRAGPAPTGADAAAAGVASLAELNTLAAAGALAQAPAPSAAW
jgi:hypothetical protein